VQEKAPVAPVVRLPEVHDPTDTESKVSPTGDVTENPVPATVACEFCGPCAGVTEIEGVVTVNGAIADVPPAFVATKSEVAVEAGIVASHVKSPEAFAVSEVEAAQLVIATPSNVRATVERGVYPVPDTVTDAPIGPCPGRALRVSEVTSKLSVTGGEDVLRSSPTIGYVPEATLGTANSQRNPPVPLVVIVVEENAHVEVVATGVWRTVLKLTVAPLFTVKPVPVTL
jgi:hypothetical protein